MNSPQHISGSAPVEQSDPMPLSIIRTETVLSKLPIHNLAKKGRVNIEIKKKNEKGAVVLRWEVSYNDRYGQPRQLAYKLDTLVVNRRIEEAGRPLPKLIRLGSLREVCKELGLSEGEATLQVKKAIHQNAGAYITAKLSYKGSDGVERTLEAGFTRYSVAFTGERLPDGKKADAVHLILNDPYWEVLNSAPMRPLNYDYLKELPPASQRFYEVISYRMFAALKYKHPHAKISYSDYCTYSAQQRYFDYNHFKKQMYKVHRPHMQSGYLAKSRYEEVVDDEGNIDWTMYYTPGPKAKAEYLAFTRKGQVIEAELELARPGGEGKRSLPQAQATKLPEQTEEAPEEQIDRALLDEFAKRGITKARSQKLLASLTPDQPVLDQLEWGDNLISSAPKGSYKNPPGFYIYLIQNNVFVPSDFETTRRRHVLEQAIEAEAARRLEQHQLEAVYGEYVQGAVDTYIEESLTEAERKALFADKKQELLKQHGYIASWSEEQLHHVLHSAVRSTIYSRVPLPSFDEFCENKRHS